MPRVAETWLYSLLTVAYIDLYATKRLSMFRSDYFLTSALLLILFYIQSWSHAAKADVNCNIHSGKSCKDCVEVSGCSYCEPTKVCESGSVVKKTLHKSCEDQEWMTGQCLVSGRVLIIALSVTGFVVLVGLTCCIYCCCCRRRKQRGPDKEETKNRKKRQEITAKHKDREAERREKRDEIRKKYGLQNV
ncbi:pituitary tumor-transforming gene 1 protein-interacting protein-like [Orbicella faveolata]|uniref:pituitary tumor-transforming gene 1 protein-interacting protein-like n=1 Tax=Orbicella faveolata TaxID=48498 RepID=UPI0009E267B0|nr:pituitary tumor-transforming gene 1 protein-interacting protein-like [Orbicella faveolata]